MKAVQHKGVLTQLREANERAAAEQRAMREAQALADQLDITIAQDGEGDWWVGRLPEHANAEASEHWAQDGHAVLAIVQRIQQEGAC